MIATDGRRTAAEHKPAHGGYPGEVRVSDLPDDPYRIVWQARQSVRLTFSLPEDGQTDRAAADAVWTLREHGIGCTVRTGSGYWGGAVEPSATIAVVGYALSAPCIIAALGALWDAGCVAIQAETTDTEGHYRVCEVRR